MRSLRRATFAAALLASTLVMPIAGQTAKTTSTAERGTAAWTNTEMLPWTPTISAAVEQEAEAVFCCDERKLGMTLIEIGTVMVVPWFFNRHVSDDSTAVLSLESWGRNIREGFEWDHDNFKTNMFAHPYHGGLYFNAGRSNGYSFWESAAWAWGGSFLWEMFGENNRGAINDWIATAVGGIAIGESLNRASRTIWDNEATGTERAFREIGGFLVNPMGGASRLFRGEMAKTGANPEDRFPAVVRTYLNAGVRHVGEGGTGASSTGGTVQFELGYGDPLVDLERPFDSFNFFVQINGRNEEEGIGMFRIRGGLWGKELSESSKVRHTFRLEQLFQYINNQTIETGGSALAASFNSRWNFSDTWNLGTRVAPAALLIWGTESEYADFTKRDYDFGTGGGLLLGAGLHKRDRPIIRVDWASIHQRNLNGAAGTHWSHFLLTRLNVPMVGRLGIGGEYWLFIRDSNYRDFPDVYRRHPEFYAFLSWDTSSASFR
ncbi:MAG: DUF3943 domain-containing protein [Gemmatimonadota bacterium]|nr:DUF3943 domain-containing protein [Gemmatimonadota bacterium]